MGPIAEVAAQKLPASPLSGLFPCLYEGLMALLGGSSEETLHLVLETLTVVVRHDREVVQQVGGGGRGVGGRIMGRGMSRCV